MVKEFLMQHVATYVGERSCGGSPLPPGRLFPICGQRSSVSSRRITSRHLRVLLSAGGVSRLRLEDGLADALDVWHRRVHAAGLAACHGAGRLDAAGLDAARMGHHRDAPHFFERLDAARLEHHRAAPHAAGLEDLAHVRHRVARLAAVLDAHRAAPLDAPHEGAFDFQGMLLFGRSWTCRASLLGFDSLSRHARSSS